MNTVDELFDCLDNLETSKNLEEQKQLENRRREYWQRDKEAQIPELASFHILNCKKKLDTTFTPYNDEDIVDLVWKAISKAYVNHDPDISEFSTFLGHVVGTTFIDYLRARQTRREVEREYAELIKCHMTAAQAKKLGKYDPETGKEFTLDNVAIDSDDLYPETKEKKNECEFRVKLPERQVRFIDFLVQQTNTNRTAILHNLIHWRLTALDMIMLTHLDENDTDRRDAYMKCIRGDVECCPVAGSEGERISIRVTTAAYIRPLLEQVGVSPERFVETCVQRYADELNAAKEIEGAKTTLAYVRKLPDFCKVFDNNIK